MMVQGKAEFRWCAGSVDCFVNPVTANWLALYGAIAVSTVAACGPGVKE